MKRIFSIASQRIFSSIPKLPRNCPGCGAIFQRDKQSQAGYLPPIAISPALDQNQIREILEKNELTMQELKLVTKKERPIICSKCHSYRHQKGEIRSQSLKTNRIQFSELKARPGGLVILVLDLLDICGTMIHDLEDYIGNKDLVILLNKYDLMPDGFQIAKVGKLLKKYHATSKAIEVLPISAKTGEGISQIVQHLTTAMESEQDCYLVGCTNVGKSTILNALKEISGDSSFATTSPTSGTTAGLIKTPFSSLISNNNSATKNSLIDTAGIVHENQLCNLFNFKELTYFVPSKPLILRKVERKSHQSILLGGFLQIQVTNSDGCEFHFYLSKKLPIIKCKTSKIQSYFSSTEAGDSKLYPPLKRNRNDFPTLQLVGNYQNVMPHETTYFISGAGWFTVVGECTFSIYSPNKMGIGVVQDSFIKYD